MASASSPDACAAEDAGANDVRAAAEAHARKQGLSEQAAAQHIRRELGNYDNALGRRDVRLQIRRVISPINNTLPRYTNIDMTSRELPISPLLNPGLFAGLNPQDWGQGQAIDLRKLFPGRQEIRNSQLADASFSFSRQMEEIYQKRVLSQIEPSLMSTTSDWTSLQQESPAIGCTCGETHYPRSPILGSRL